MAQGALEPSGIFSTGEEVHLAKCRCGHEYCDSLKDDKWCCHWFFLYWVSSSEVLPSEIVRVLRGLLGTRDVEYFIRPEADRVFRMLVYVEDSSDLGGDQLGLVPERDNWDFLHEHCRAFRLPCCQDALLLEWEYLRNRLDYDDRNGLPLIATYGPRNKNLLDRLNDSVMCKVSNGRKE